MRCGVAMAVLAVLVSAGPARGQASPPSEKLIISAKSASTWGRGGEEAIQLQGAVSVSLDGMDLRADEAVVWLTSAADLAPGQQHLQIAAFGHVVLTQPGPIRRSGDRLFVPAEVRAVPRITADERTARDRSDTPLYQRAVALRKEMLAGAQTRVAPTTGAATRPQPAATRPRPATSRPARQAVPLAVNAGEMQTTDDEEGYVAVVAWGGVHMFGTQPNGDMLEMQCQRAVLYTALESLRDANKQERGAKARDLVTAVYLEGDVRMVMTPASPKLGEQRLEAEQVYYELATDRAILTRAVVHTVEPMRQVPFIFRAKTVRQLAKGEFDTKKVQLTSSKFIVPSYSIAADRLYVRTEATGDPDFPERITFEAAGAKLEAYNLPFFYLPFVSGSVGDRPGALRELSASEESDFGFAMRTQWGLFETLGVTPPRDLDAAYRLDYYTERGPGFGLDAAYGGGIVQEDTKQPWNFQGDLKSYFVDDHGVDRDYGRQPVDPDQTLRGRVIYEHQHFFPGGWSAQLRAGYVSDPTFLEEWFPREFYQEGPIDIEAYVKRQRDTEAFTLLVQAQPNRLITSADYMQEQFEVERLPMAGYHRIGDSFADDNLTFFSDNSGGGLRFQSTRATLRQQGFLPGQSPGIPSLGTTGINPDVTWRGDFRQEIDFPLTAGQFRVTPYVIGRYTQYSNSPGGAEEARLFAGAGARVSTSFWKVDPTAQSDLFDVHQLRHIIQPELNLFTSATTVDRQHLFIYEEPVDAINDVSVAEVALRQRWQTKRGGPGNWRSVDLFSLDLEADFYANKPNRKTLDPYDFRGLFFPTLPEASIPRDALSLDASWRISDNTVILGDAQYNLDASKMATAAIGVLVRRDVALSYYLGNRYIGDLNSNITSFQIDYQINAKYTIDFSQDFDFGLGKNVTSSLAIIRRFDRFLVLVRVFHEQITGQSGIGFSLFPEGFGQGVDSSRFSGPFQR